MLKKKRNNKRLINLPPGPKGLPILGNLLMLGEFPHRDLLRLSEEHGSIMYLRLGFIPTIVVSSPEAAELFLKTYDLIFASRPFNEAAKYISYERKGLSFSEYGPYWRNVRKLCTLELLSTLKIESFKAMRREELGSFIESLKEASRAHLEVNLSAKVLALSTDMSCMMVFGKKYIHNDNKIGFHAVVQEGMQLAAIFNIADYIPYIGALDIQGLAKRMKAVSKVFDDMFEKIIDEHVHAGDKGHQRDFVDVMLSFMESKENEFQIDRSNIKAIILDMLVGSMDTSSTAIEWAFAELLKHPYVMKKVQQELERVVGLDKMVEESDLMSLEYLDMVVKESLRLHPVAPLLIPHESTEDCTVNGYYIPKKSRIIVNTWAIGRDPKVWDNPEKFIPERFIGSSIEYKGRDFQFLPFGSGRRGCPGMQLGLTMIKLVVAQLIHCFDWELPNGMLCTDLNMDEEFGLTMPRAKPLLVIPAYRLSN
ncbi:hypothetical protein AQUCO_06800086v1 [Aquilegia coerulea]|uniref:Cytochrome P450 n=1 Tax=Aquilegia coerulea TaxID=218851 RepID=A0A2G5CBM9_AQUCA|nr:hypothetical protein AQUCO_06800086v1 [Aquilegia coerulea]